MYVNSTGKLYCYMSGSSPMHWLQTPPDISITLYDDCPFCYVMLRLK